MDSSEEKWFNALYEKSGPRLYKLCLYRLHDPQAAQDLVQEAFATLIDKLEIVRGHPNPEGWLVQALKFLMLQWLETEGKRTEHELSVESRNVQLPATVQGWQLRETFPAGLTELERRLLVWHYEQMVSYEEIAERLGIPAMTCRTQMYRARQHLKRLIEEENKKFSESAK